MRSLVHILIASLMVATSSSNPMTMIGSGMYWHDDSFEDMTAWAELIAVVEISKGDPFFSRARVVDTLKGKKPEGEDFIITGYNNTRGSQAWIDSETLETGERLLAFLIPAKDKFEGEPAWIFPTPTSGDLRIRDGKLHGSWYRTTSPQLCVGIPVDIGAELVRGLVAHQADKTPERANKLIRKLLTTTIIDAADAEEKTLPRGPVASQIQWLLCAQACYGDAGLDPVIQHASKSKADFVVVGAARALNSLEMTPENLTAAGRALKFYNSYAQTEACEALRHWNVDASTAAKLILPAIHRSDRWRLLPRTSTDVVLNTTRSGREMMIRTLTETRAGDIPNVEENVTAFIRFEDGGIDEGVYAALAEHFLFYPSETAQEKFLALYRVCAGEDLSTLNQYILRDGSRPCVEAAAARILDWGVSEYGRNRAVDQFAIWLPAGNPTILKTLDRALKQFPDSEPVAIAAMTAHLKNGTDTNFDRAKAILPSIDRESRHYWEAINLFTTLLPTGSTKLAGIASAELKKASGWQRLPLWVAAAKAQAPEMLALLKKQKPTVHGDERKPSPMQTNLLAMLINFVEIKQDPPADTRKHLDSLVAIFARDEGGTLFSYILEEEFKLVAAAEKPYAIESLRKGIAAENFQLRFRILGVIHSLGAELTTQEAAILDREKTRNRDVNSMQKIQNWLYPSPKHQGDR